MKRLLQHFGRTIATLTLAAVAATVATAPASAQLSALKSAQKPVATVAPPTREAAPTVSPLAGAWQGAVQGPQQRMMFQMMVFPDGTYKARIIIETAPGENGPTEPVITPFGGQWKIEGQELVLTNEADGTVERTAIELQGDNLIMKGLGPDGSNLTMQRVQVNAGPNNGPVGPHGGPVGPNGEPMGPNGRPVAGPPSSDNPKIPGPGPNVPGSQPENRGPAAAPVVGTWYGSGVVQGAQMDCKVHILPDGTYHSQIIVRQGSLTNNLTEEGSWKLRGRKILFETGEESSYIPFKVENGVLILDYSEEVGIIGILSRTPGRGQIQEVGEGDGY